MVTLERTLKGIRWTVLVCGIGGLLALVPYIHNRLPADGILIIDEARFSLERAATESIVQSLLDDWYLNHPGAGNGWYRIIVDLREAPKRRWAVYLPTTNMNAAVYLNGKLIGDGGDFDEPVARN